MNPIRVEIDTPASIYLSSRDFTGFLVDRQVNRPLFSEFGDSIGPGLLSTIERDGERRWTFRVAPDAHWDTGDRIHAEEVASRLVEVAKTSQHRWLASVMARLDVRDRSTLTIMTRFPISDLEAVLTSPVLSPRRDRASSGAYRRMVIDDRRTVLTPRCSGSIPDIELITTSSRQHGRADFERGALDIGWGIGVPVGFWDVNDDGPFVKSSALDVFAVVVAASSIPERDARMILGACRLERSAAYGVLPLESRYRDDGPSDQVGFESGSGRTSWPLHYTGFPPNAELAHELSQVTGGRLKPHRVPYGNLIRGEPPGHGFALHIHSAVTAGDAGLQIESASVASGLIATQANFRATSLALWGGGSAVERRNAAMWVERRLDRLLRRKVIGRFVPRFRAAHPFPIPRTGWFDFSHLRKQRNSNDDV